MRALSRHDRQEAFYARPWPGPYRRHDPVKEFSAALAVIALLTVALAVVFGSTGRKAITIAEWATQAPEDFVGTAVSELDGTSATAQYGAPYNDNPTADEQFGPLTLQQSGGVRDRIDTANDFVIQPLTASTNSTVEAALVTYRTATLEQQLAWATAYGDALSAAPDGDPEQVAPGDYGPVPQLAAGLLALAKQGVLDRQLQDQRGAFTQTLLFLGDGDYFQQKATAEHLNGRDWGTMGETALQSGQAWLCLYPLWYQVKPFAPPDNRNAIVWGVMILLAIGLVLLPLIPGLRSLPRWLGVHRLIWRSNSRGHHT